MDGQTILLGFKQRRSLLKYKTCVFSHILGEVDAQGVI